jgi:hypothetical protein
LHHIDLSPHALHHLALAHIRSITLDRGKPELGVQAEQAQAEDFTNLALDQGKAPVHLINALIFYFNIDLCFTLIVH